MGFQNLPDAPVEEADVVFLGVPFERTVTGASGTTRAPEAILAAGMDVEYFEERLGWSPFLHMKQTTLRVPERIGEFDALEGYLDASLEGVGADSLLIALGGEHSITSFLVRRRMPRPGTVVVFDAHADYRVAYRGERHNHACAIYRIKELGHRVIVVGVRSFFENEREWMARDGVELWDDWRLREPGAAAALAKRLAALEGELYVSIDMDAFGPGVVPGVGTPQPGGLGWYEFLALFEPLMCNEQATVRGVDLVELVPDPMRVSEVTAAKLLQKTVSYWGWTRGFRNGPQRGSQSEVRYE